MKKNFLAVKKKENIYTKTHVFITFLALYRTHFGCFLTQNGLFLYTIKKLSNEKYLVFLDFVYKSQKRYIPIIHYLF